MSFVSCLLVNFPLRRVQRFIILERTVVQRCKDSITHHLRKKQILTLPSTYSRKCSFCRSRRVQTSSFQLFTTLASHSEVCLPKKLEDLCQDLYQSPDKSSKLWKLVEWGNGLTETLPVEERISKHKVAGCASVVYIKVTLRNEKVFLRGFADSKVAKGLLFLLLSGLQDTAVQQVKTLSAEVIIQKAGLETILSSSRMGGIKGMLRYIQQHCNLLQKPEGAPSCSDSHQYSTDSEKDEIAVLLSGGVDSSVALSRLLEQGYRVKPFYLRIWLEDELSHLGKCPWEEDLVYANAVCEHFGLKLEQVTLQKEYWEQVVEYTISEARAGRTPNPDVMCNSRIKFGVFLDSIGKTYQKIASGHYARIQKEPSTGLFQLMTTRKGCISNWSFDKGTNSQGICFLGQIKFDDFLRHHLGTRPGKLVEAETGQVVGEHCGYWFYTPGQRKGLRLPNGPWYVLTKDVESNTVFVSRNYDSPEKQRNCFIVENVHWHIPLRICTSELLAVQVKLRHGNFFHQGFIMASDDGTRAKR
ncbi:tRNA-specific 2-thiouridylase MnmA [Galdieria sulphuraria]|nr:tRNA-specific 2-thiouridylase MnmA [Galdieria sulphuraria]